MNTYQEIWNDMLALLKDRIGEKSFNDVFKDCTKVHKFENDYIFVIVPNVVIKFRIQSFYVNKLNELLPYVTDKKIGFKFIKEDEINEGLMMEIAQETGGKFYRAKNETELEQIYNTINQLEKTEFSPSSIINRTDFYQPLLLLAVLALFAGLIAEKILFINYYIIPR